MNFERPQGRISTHKGEGRALSNRQAVVPCDTDIPYGGSDMPEGTIVTEPYFSDVLAPVELAR